jgi:hypothetical protein
MQCWTLEENDQKNKSNTVITGISLPIPLLGTAFGPCRIKSKVPLCLQMQEKGEEIRIRQMNNNKQKAKAEPEKP